MGKEEHGDDPEIFTAACMPYYALLFRVAICCSSVQSVHRHLFVRLRWIIVVGVGGLMFISASPVLTMLMLHLAFGRWRIERAWQ